MPKTPHYLDQVQQPDDNHADLVKAFARRFIASQRGEFTVEDVRAAYLASGYPEPKEKRVWGIMQILSNEGLIYSTKIGRAKEKSRNGGYLSVWRRTPQFEQFNAPVVGGVQAKLF